MDHPLDDPIAEKERLKKISENADAKILEEMFGGKADDCICVFRLSFVAFISETEKGVNMIPLKEITDYQQLAYKLGKRMLEIGNATNTLEFLQCCLRQVLLYMVFHGLCGGKLNSDDFAKLSTTCNVLKEERKKEEKIGTKKGKKKGKTTISLKVSNDTWQDQMDDEDYAGYDDDFMYFCLCKQFD